MTEPSEGDNGRAQFFVYHGVGAVPFTVTHLRFDPSVEIISPFALLHCVRLGEVELPEGPEKIERNTFSRCRNLEIARISSPVREIGKYAFQDFCRLKAIDLP